MTTSVVESDPSVLADLWRLAGGDPAALARVALTGADPVLPSSFRIGACAQATLAAAGLAAAEIWRERTGRAQQVRVDMRHAAIEFSSERYLSIEGQGDRPAHSPVHGLFRTRDGRPVRLHAGFPHHRDRVVKLLGAQPTRESVAAALARCDAFEFEDAAFDAGCVVAALRTADEWAVHPQGRALASSLPLIIERIGDAPPRPLPPGDRPLSGLRVLDLTRVIAGPVCGRTLAAHGADVIRIASPHLPFIDWLVKDTGRGKLSAHVDLATAEGRAALRALLGEADVFVQGYRPGSIAAHGFAPADLARERPGIVAVSLCAWGWEGPWSHRRGFDSLVQTASGYNHAETEAVSHPPGRAREPTPRQQRVGAHGDEMLEMPCQTLDHGSGQLMAFGAMMARLRQAREGGSWHVRVALAATGRWLWGLGRVADGFSVQRPAREAVADLLESSVTPYGTMRGVRHSALLSETPPRWERPSVPLGSHPPRWP